MSRRDLSFPLAILIAGLLLVAVMILDLPRTRLSAQVNDPCPVASYPNPNDRAACQQTATARAGNATATAYPVNAPTQTNTPSPVPTSNSSNTQPAPTTAPSSPTTTVSARIPTVPAAATAATATPRPQATPTSTTQAPPSTPGQQLPTATSALTGLETIDCVPGTTVVLEGAARPHAQLLIFFAEQPVGGAFSSHEGRYRATMRIGNERPGVYLVEVRERDGRALVRELACVVTGGTPTPTWPYNR